MPFNDYLWPFYGNLSYLKARLYIPFLLAAAVLAFPSEGLAQDDTKTTFPLENFYVKRTAPTWRKIFKNFRVGLSTGYGNTLMSHSLAGYGIIQAPGGSPQIFEKGGTSVRFTNWVTGVSADSSAVKPGSKAVSSDSAKLGFRGHALNIPLKLTLHYEYQRYRFGVGYSYELMSIGSLHPISYSDRFGNFKPPGSTGFMKKYFVMLGASFYRIDNYLFTGDLNIGGWNPGSNFSGIQKGMYYNLGVTAERELSEYLRVFVRPSYDFKSYKISIPEGPAISQSMNAFYLNVGITYTLPELPKCFKHDCKIQMNHAHGNKEYRSRVHPIYKKQNPAYGEDNPGLIKYKGKNKKKLNPY
jgi:hypothetical protein